MILEEIVARLGGEGLRRERDDLAREAAPLEAEERSSAAALGDIETLAETRQALDARRRTRKTAQSTIEARERKAAGHRERAVKLTADLERVRMMGSFRRFFSGLDPARLARERASAGRQAQAAAEAARALGADLPKLDAELSTLRGEVQALAAKTAHYPPDPQSRSHLEALRTNPRPEGPVNPRPAILERSFFRKKEKEPKRKNGGLWKMTPLMEILKTKIPTVALAKPRQERLSHIFTQARR